MTAVVSFLQSSRRFPAQFRGQTQRQNFIESGLIQGEQIEGESEATGGPKRRWKLKKMGR